MTKEEIINKFKSEKIIPSLVGGMGYCKIYILPNNASEAMDEYAKQQAVEFGNKLRYGLLNNQQNLLIPTEQLYDLFLKQQQNVP